MLFLKVTFPQNKAFSNQNKGHIYIYITWNLSNKGPQYLCYDLFFMSSQDVKMLVGTGEGCGTDDDLGHQNPAISTGGCSVPHLLIR